MDKPVLKEQGGVRICEKAYLTLEEGAAYFGIGKHKLRELSNDPRFVLWVGSRRLLKKKQLEEYLDQQYSI